VLHIGGGGRVILSRPSGSDYINAVYVDSTMMRGSFIVTQLPLPNTLQDFWLMAWQRAAVIVILNEPNPTDDPVSI
jgi:protein tyrosine phosphatase